MGNYESRGSAMNETDETKLLLALICGRRARGDALTEELKQPASPPPAPPTTAPPPGPRYVGLATFKSLPRLTRRT